MNTKPAIAIDLGGTKIKIGLVRCDAVLASVSINADSNDGLQKKLPAIKNEIEKLLQQQALSVRDVSGMGMAVPGIVDSIKKKILSIDKKFGDAPETDLAAWCKESFGWKLSLENDARTALIGEWKYGKAKDCDNIVLMTLGTGIGSSAIMEGKILRGKHFLAGILGGHSVINYKGSLCNCGNIGCGETEASTWMIAEKVKRSNVFAQSALAKENTIDFESIFRCAENGDVLAQQIKIESLDAWCAAAINLIHAYDPEMLILSGGIMASSESIVPYMQQKISQHAWTPWGKVKIETSALINTAALLGAGWLVNNE